VKNNLKIPTIIPISHRKQILIISSKMPLKSILMAKGNTILIK